MFSKKKKPDAKAEGAASAAANAATASGENPAAAPAADSSAAAGAPEGGPAEAPSGGGLLSTGLAAKSKGTPGVAASRLGGRPPSRPSAPAPDPAPAPPEPVNAAPPPPPPMPVSTFNGPGSSMTGVANPLAAGGESDMSRSGRMMAMPGAPQEVAVEEQSTDAKGNVKNPYKLNLAFDIVLPFGMCLVLVGGFAMSMSAKVVKHKHDIYGLSKEEQQTQVRDQYLASQKVMDDVKKMDPIVKLEAGDTAGALALATPMGKAAFELCAQQGMDAPQKGSSSQAPSKEELATEEKTVRELLAAGTVLARAGNKKDKDIGLTYMQKAEDIATYSKYVRLLFARELARTHHDEEAITQYEAINKLFLDPWILPHKELAPLYMRANRGADAVAELQLLMKTDPTDPGYQRQLGLAMAQNGDQQAGFEEFQKGFTHEQDVLSYPSAVKSLVDAHGGLVDATLADVKKQAEKSPQDIKLQLDLARLEIATQKLKEARDVMETARKTQELNPEVHEVMAEVMCRQNQQSSGYDEFRSAAQNLHLQQ